MQAIDESTPRVDRRTFSSGWECHVLVVDDDAINRMVLKSMLGKFGCTSVLAENGCEALNCLEKEVFDVVLMDIQMPLMDGIEATRTVRTSLKFASISTIPIIAVTAYTDALDRERFFSAGVNGYVAKPFDKKDIKSAIEKVLAARI